MSLLEICFSGEVAEGIGKLRVAHRHLGMPSIGRKDDKVIVEQRIDTPVAQLP